MANDERAYGTEARDAPVTRAELERALRGIHSAHLELREQVLQLAAHVVALTDELTRRIDGVEPRPAPPNTLTPAATRTVEVAVEAQIGETLAHIRAGDARREGRIAIGEVIDKYEVEASQPPCEELIPICKGRCCQLRFALTTQDLDEGIIRWDYGRPYMIRQRASDRACVHNDPATKFCTVREVRPATCRTYHCKDDKRIWEDFANRIPAAGAWPPERDELADFDLMARARARSLAQFAESDAITETFAEGEPRRGPPVTR
ncbi:MAG: hypothetical protein SFX73_13130 [Kofleriaceae bacterium]|nr:hypothetical protein [Kofleriaceae bacterium]